jgi:hypothetical protein
MKKTITLFCIIASFITHHPSLTGAHVAGIGLYCSIACAVASQIRKMGYE